VFGMNELLWFGFGAVISAALDWAVSFWRRRQEKQRRADAAAVLLRHRLTSHLYIATVGVDDAELRSALDTFAFTGHIITNAKGEVVGKLARPLAKGPRLRLVVSND
jgi:hypothetical protein